MIVLDSWALLAYLKDENSADRIESAWIEEGATICSINLGEVLYIRMRGDGEDAAAADIDRVRQRLDVVDPDWPLISEAARVKAHGGLSYADAFCLATALRFFFFNDTATTEIVDRAAEHSCAVVDLRAPTG